MLINYKKLHSIVKKKFIKFGVKKNDAEIVTSSLVLADLKGHSSHGVLRSLDYINKIKDDKIVIYGFVNSSEQSFFKLLQSVQGVGPRAALSLLSTLSVDEVVLAISSGDKTMLSRADGIGPKVAGRIASELLDKVSVFNISNSIRNTDNKFNKNEQDKLNFQENDYDGNISMIVEDIISALINLGYGRSEVFSVVMKIKNDFSHKKQNKLFTVKTIVPIALKELSR
jgi:Holliday junction DNA helicase RuvA